MRLRATRAGLLLTALCTLAACTNSKIELSPHPERDNAGEARPGVGVGLGVRIAATTASCNGLGDCGNGAGVTGLSVEVDSLALSVSSITDVDTACGSGARCSGGFTLTGRSEGEAELDVTSDQADECFDVRVASVGFTKIALSGSWERLMQSANHASDGAPPRLSVLAGSTFDVQQTHFTRTFVTDDAPRETVLLGRADYELSPGTTDAIIDPSGHVASGSALGSASVTTLVGGRLDFDVVPGAEVSGWQLWDLDQLLNDGDAILDELAMRSSMRSVTLVPRDELGLVIFGAGDEEPTVEVGDPTLLAVSAESDGLFRVLDIEALAAGSTTMTVTWQGIAREFAVSVSEAAAP